MRSVRSLLGRSLAPGAGAFALTLVAIVGTATPSLAQSTPSPFSVRVLSTASGDPVKVAIVLLEERPDLVSQDMGDGTFIIRDVPPGTYHVLVTAPGFVASRLELTIDAGTLVQQVELVPELHYTEVISVSAAPRDQFIAYQPTSVLAGQDLAIKLEGSLGSALKSQPGLSERSFGPAPARPIIRGLDGDRVLILENGQRTGDLSSQSGDHGVTVNPAAAARLEVVRGPAALLYGANGIGGLVNVITDQIPTRPVTGVSGTAIFDVGSAASEGGAAGTMLVGNGRWAFTAGGAGRGSGDYATAEGTVENTQSRSGLGSVGLSFTGDDGFLGATYGYTDQKYGVPIIEEGLVELTPRRHAFSLRGERRRMSGFMSGVRANAAYRSYRHDELVAGEPETAFENDTLEMDVLANHREAGRLTGTFGGWGMTRAFSSSGAEALSPPVDQNGFALFLFEEVTWPHVTLQFGGRWDAANFDVQGGELPNRDFDNLSGSVGLLLRPGENTTIAVSLARAARNPALEELYYFGPHPGNFAFEIGNPNLDSEKAVGLDLSFRWRLPRLSGEVTYFRNDINDFIFRQPLSEEAFDERFGELEEGGDHGEDGEEEHAHGEFPIVEYVGADSLLQGFEAHTDIDITSWLVGEIAFDYVRGELSATGEPLPRMPPFRFIGGLRYQKGGLQFGGELTAVAEQDRVFEEETPTDGYGAVKLFGSYSFITGDAVNTITARVDNVGDTLYRNHLSLVKDELPEMGRNFKLVYSISF